MYTFIVTNLDMKPYQTIQFYYNRSKMENFIKESKSRIDFATVSNNSKIVNSNHMRFHIFVYNLFNWFRRLVLSTNMRNQQVDTIYLFKADKDCYKGQSIQQDIYHIQTVQYLSL